MLYIVVEILLDEGVPTPADFAAREQVVHELDRLKIGKLEGLGDGPGHLEFSYTVHHPLAAEEKIKDAVARHFPDREFTMRMSDD